MTKERKEQLSNRLVLNFGVLLGGALILLYVFNALRSTATVEQYTYIFLLTVAVISLIGGLILFFVGQKKDKKMRNYSGIFLGTLIGSVAIYITKLGFIPNYSKTTAVITVYIAMVVYFIVLAIITSIQMKKPIEKPIPEDGARRNKKKKRKKK